MTAPTGVPDGAALASEIRSLAHPLTVAGDLDPLIDRVSAARLVCIGEASHGTHEYYRWRAELSCRLIEEHGFTWIGVEGDWPDCWRINRWVRGHADQPENTMPGSLTTTHQGSGNVHCCPTTLRYEPPGYSWRCL